MLYKREFFIKNRIEQVGSLVTSEKCYYFKYDPAFSLWLKVATSCYSSERYIFLCVFTAGLGKRITPSCCTTVKTH